MRRSLLIVIAMLLAGCAVSVQRQPIPTTLPTRTPALVTPVPTATSVPTITPRPTVTPFTADVFNIVVLGQDETVARCAKGERCGGDSHSDVLVIVHLVMTEPVQVTAILVPRNLWVPNADMVPGTYTNPFPDMWAMQVYGKTGFAGVHDYVYRVFGLPVQAVVVVKMDRFTQLIDSLGGLDVAVVPAGSKHMSGDEVLAYLRDNNNNWGCLVYDCENRIWRVGQTLTYKLLADPLWLLRVPGLWESDTSITGMLAFVPVAQQIARGYNVKFIHLWTPEVQRGDTPLDVRGMVPSVPLWKWTADLLDIPLPVTLEQRFERDGIEATASTTIRRCLHYSVLIDRWNPDFHLDPNLVLAIAAAESACDPYATNSMHATGLMQVIPRSWTASEEALLDPATNIFWGMKILHFAIEEGKSVVRGLQLYNCGQATLKDHPNCGLDYAIGVIGFWLPRIAAQRGIER